MNDANRDSTVAVDLKRAPPVVLIIDDNEAIRVSYAAYLTDFGFQCTVAEDGQKGLDKLAAQRPDVVLLDLRMPGMDGIEVLRSIAASAPNIPVVVISGKSSTNDLVAALRLGAWDFLQKPVLDMNILVHTVSRAVAHARLQRDKQRNDEKLKKSNRQLEIAVAEAEKARAAAEEAYRAKSSFFEKLSDELRIPAMGAEAMVELLLESPLSEDQHRLAQVAQSNLASLAATIGNLVDFSRVESGRINLERLNFQVEQVVKAAISRIRRVARQREIELDWSVASDMPLYYTGDPWRIGQILFILLENAIKFTPRGRVTIHVSSERHTEGSAQVKFSVTDTGIGIRQEALTSLFQAFNITNTMETGGLGLGLALARRLANLMGGNIGVASQLGQGSTFWLTVNLERQPEGTEQDDTGLSLKTDTVAERPTHHLKVLVADPDLDAQLVVGAYLNRIGFEHQMARDGTNVLSHLEETKFDLLLIDVDLGGISGLETAGVIRSPISAVLDHRIPIVGMCPNPGAEIRSRCAQAGIDYCIPKPFSFVQLMHAVDKVIGKRQQVVVSHRE